jgi:hypothetical protein
MQLARFLLLSLAGISSAGCTKDNDSGQSAIQNIEETIQMPGEAHPLDSYERYYARRPDGMIVGVYTNHDKGHRRDVMKACANFKDAPFPCPVDGKGIRLVQAGESLWLDDPMNLPAMNGGGCAQVTIEYRPSTEQIARVECNGPY